MASSNSGRVVHSPSHFPSLAEFTLRGPVLPLYLDAVRVADKFRAAALSRHGTRSQMLAGKDPEGRPLADGHRHAHYVPDSRDSRGRVTHVVVWAPAGLGPSDQEALASISHLNLQDGRAGQWAGRDPLTVMLDGFGEADHTRGSRLFQRGRRWRSRTPFVLPRHPKRDHDRPEEQLVRELLARRFPKPRWASLTSGVSLGAAGVTGITKWASFEVRRRKARPTTPVLGFEIEFDEPVDGPLLLGWGSHYGLGAFELIE